MWDRPGANRIARHQTEHRSLSDEDEDQIYPALFLAEGVRNFKAKGIQPNHLQALIDAAHAHGATVTAHLDSGYRNSVEPGKLADLVIVTGNSLEDIRNTRHVHSVIRAGMVYDSGELMGSVKGKLGVADLGMEAPPKAPRTPMNRS